MPKYVIEREIPGIGGWSAEQLQKTSEVLREPSVYVVVRAVIDRTTAER